MVSGENFLPYIQPNISALIFPDRSKILLHCVHHNFKVFETTTISIQQEDITKENAFDTSPFLGDRPSKKKIVFLLDISRIFFFQGQRHFLISTKNLWGSNFLILWVNMFCVSECRYLGSEIFQLNANLGKSFIYEWHLKNSQNGQQTAQSDVSGKQSPSFPEKCLAP